MNRADLERACSRLGLTLPSPPHPVGNYLPLVILRDFAFLSGQISKDAQGKVMTGKVGKDIDVEKGKQAARLALLQAMSLIENQLGLHRIEQVLRMAGFIQSAPDFYGQSDVMNAASDLLVELLGTKARHARTSIGVASLPLNAAVELELTLNIGS